MQCSRNQSRCSNSIGNTIAASFLQLWLTEVCASSADLFFYATAPPVQLLRRVAVQVVTLLVIVTYITSTRQRGRQLMCWAHLQRELLPVLQVIARCAAF